MRRNAFTLVELLVVISIVVLLVAMLAPTLGTARGLARSSLCQTNLRQLSVAFGQAKAVGGAAKTPAMNYPAYDKWPSIPYNVRPVDDLFVCPEDVLTAAKQQQDPGSQTGDIDGLKFFSSLGKTDGTGVLLDFKAGGQCLSQRGVGPDGRGYTEYVIEDATWVAPTWGDPANPGSYSRNDGIWRLWDPVPGGRGRKLELISCTCTWQNKICLDGNVIPQFDVPLKSRVGNSIEIYQLPTSYGINENSGRFDFATRKVLLLDYAERFARPSDAANFLKLLRDPQSARHGGKINYLRADTSVETLGPTELYVRRAELFLP